MPQKTGFNPKDGTLIIHDPKTGWRAMSQKEEANFRISNPEYAEKYDTMLEKLGKTSVVGGILAKAAVAPQVLDWADRTSRDSSFLGFKTPNEARLFGYGVPDAPSHENHGVTESMGNFGKTLIGGAEDLLHARTKEQVDAFSRLNGAEGTITALSVLPRGGNRTEAAQIKAGMSPSGYNSDAVNQQYISSLAQGSLLAVAQRDAILNDKPLPLTVPRWKPGMGTTTSALPPGVKIEGDLDTIAKSHGYIKAPATPAPAAAPAVLPPHVAAAHAVIAAHHAAQAAPGPDVPTPAPTVNPPIAPPTPAGGLTPLPAPTGAAGAFQVPQAQNDVAPPNALRTLLGVPANA
jgi:hypothetical protein